MIKGVIARVRLVLLAAIVSLPLNRFDVAAQDIEYPDWLPKFIMEFSACTEDGKCGQIATEGTFWVEQFCNPEGPSFDVECFHDLNGTIIYDCNRDGDVDPEFSQIDCIIHSILSGKLVFEWLDNECNVKRESFELDEEHWVKTMGEGEVDLDDIPPNWNHFVMVDLQDVSGTHGSINDCPRCPKKDRIKVKPEAIKLGLGEN